MKNNTYVSSLLAASIVTATVGSIAEAGTIRHDRSDSDYRNLANLFPSVGYLGVQGSSAGWSCSGTLISSTWVLTAAHCIDGMSSASFTVGKERSPVSRAIYGDALGWMRTKTSNSGSDIGLMQLRNPIRYTTPSRIYTGSREQGQQGTYVGYGRTGTGNIGNVYNSNQNANTGGLISSNPFVKRAGKNIVDRVGGPLNRLLYTDFDHPNWFVNSWTNRMGSAFAEQMEFSTAPGDSGGALFINGLLAGVVTGGDGRSTYGELAWNTRVSSFSSWINSVISGQRMGTLLAGSFSRQTTNSWFDDSTTAFVPDEPLEFDDYDANQPYQVDIFGDDAELDGEMESVPEPSTVVGILAIAAFMFGFRRHKQVQTKM